MKCSETFENWKGRKRSTMKNKNDILFCCFPMFSHLKSHFFFFAFGGAFCVISEHFRNVEILFSEGSSKNEGLKFCVCFSLWKVPYASFRNLRWFFLSCWKEGRLFLIIEIKGILDWSWDCGTSKELITNISLETYGRLTDNCSDWWQSRQ